MDEATAGPGTYREELRGRTAEQDPARPLAVGMLASMFPPSIGGIQSHTLRLGQALADRGVAVHVVTRIQPGLPPFERMGAVRVHRVGVAAARGAAGSAAFVAAATARVLRLAPQLDVLHAHQLLSPTSVGLLAAPLARLPLVVNPHACGTIGDVGVLSSTRLGRARLRAVVRRADAFVAVSRTIRGELLSAGAPPHAVWSIVNGVDTDRFAPASSRERLLLRRTLGLDEGPLVVYAGRLAPEKGPDVLLAAWPRLSARVPGARLLLLGSGPEEGALRAQAHALRIDETVIFGGGVQDVAPWLRAADVAVLPSRTEGMPVALLEALSCELPVVATRVGGSAEVLEDGVTGWLVPPDQPVALAEALADALLDREAGARRAAAGRALVQERYAMERTAQDFLSLYRAVVWRHRTGRALAVAGPPGPR